MTRWMKTTPPNKLPAVDAAITLLLHRARHERGTTEQSVSRRPFPISRMLLTLVRILFGVDMALGFLNYVAWRWLAGQRFNVFFQHWKYYSWLYCPIIHG